MTASSYKKTEADADIELCIDNAKNFKVLAGAGSGKTGSLVRALAYIRSKHEKSLRADGQQVACITFTNAAVDIIKSRTDLDDLFAVSTIHGFLWSLVKNYDANIRATLKDELIPLRIAKKQDEDNGGNSIRALEAREKVRRLLKDLEAIVSVNRFFYDEGGKRDYSAGFLDHDDIADLVPMMIKRFPALQKIIAQKFPYIFIDEAQDTFCQVIEAFNLVVEPSGLPIIGYFGDPMQQIYDNRAGDFNGPAGTVLIKKCENYRCSTEVIKLLNVIRPTLEQVPGDKNVTGSVKIRLIQAEAGEGERNTYTVEQQSNALRKFDEALQYFNWAQDLEVKKLFLTRQMIAHRLGFSGLNRLFTGRFSSLTAQDHFKEGNHFALKPFMDVLVPLMTAYQEKNQVSIMKLLRDRSPLLHPNGVNQDRTVQDVVNQAHEAVDILGSIWSSASIKEILKTANKYHVIEVSETLKDHLNRSPRTEVYDERIHEREKGDWLLDEFLKLQTTELLPYRNFILNLTPFNTQHGVKGDQFKKVLVVFDDTEANWNNFNFSRLLTPTTAGKEPTSGQKQRSLNIAYVCFSRAVSDLGIIFFTLNPLEAKRELIAQKLFSEEQVSIQLT